VEVFRCSFQRSLLLLFVGVVVGVGSFIGGIRFVALVLITVLIYLDSLLFLLLSVMFIGRPSFHVGATGTASDVRR
jgi:hypothetical protein